MSNLGVHQLFLRIRIERQALEHNAHGKVEDGVHHGKHSHEEEVGIPVLHLGSNELAKMGADKGRQDKVRAFFLTHHEGCRHANPANQFALSQKRDAVADRLNGR